MPLQTGAMPPTALVCAALADGAPSMAQAHDLLAATLGPIRVAGEPYSFDFTGYYEREMGSRLTKQLLWFEREPAPSELAAIKRSTMALERQLAREVGGQLRRRVNIDPGLVTIESLVLATTKYSGHRVCIEPGLYAEVTLLYQGGRYAPLPWTYPDYRTAPVHDLLRQIRAYLRNVPAAGDSPQP